MQLEKLCTKCGETKLAAHGTDDIANIVPACRTCNSRKHTRTATEFLQAAA